MYSLLLTCAPEEVDLLSSELWEAGTIGIQELDRGSQRILIVHFPEDHGRAALLARFERYSPEWQYSSTNSWLEETRRAWPARSIGSRLFLAPAWNDEPTPLGRERLVHNPGLACGTGEHPCTQLALMALEKSVRPGCSVVDVGTGSGILAIAALRLDAGFAVGIDTDEAVLGTATENFLLNGFTPTLVAGSAECVASEWADVTVANISGTVLLSIMDELIRITRVEGRLILTGFSESELGVFQRVFSHAEVSQMDQWRCVLVRLSESVC